jgi:hypothetical protein
MPPGSSLYLEVLEDPELELDPELDDLPAL